MSPYCDGGHFAKHGKSAQACTLIFLGQRPPQLRLSMFATPVGPYLVFFGGAPLS